MRRLPVVFCNRSKLARVGGDHVKDQRAVMTMCGLALESNGIINFD